MQMPGKKLIKLDVIKNLRFKKGNRDQMFTGEKRTQTSEDLKVCRHGREFLIPCTHYRDPYFDFRE